MSTLVNRADFFGIGLNRTVDMGFQMDLGMGSCGGGGGGWGLTVLVFVTVFFSYMFMCFHVYVLFACFCGGFGVHFHLGIVSCLMAVFGFTFGDV